ncbi:cystathionine gamma-synthase family protein [Denitromonas ohlonensis]|uniref:Cystathionine gamma-synthase family protein n=2 Tax=Denitromonas TaxID=139331 RepID=A0A558E7Z7_9RHOO|nr:cystathionine gamma-synthase family protein [Denitromonas ohlonensis]TVT44550.1 MAG: cystathionine gamma-synthase family protein [Denitromonas halophila]TVO59196.1 cystathionine gamma-synthase family protein [Denitromonas ohlonensis]TVO73413.1 cystathionine gamma-synthase family protein [Denitromonas ohlonensis]TVT63901.1 MAG: cystathionine gamma-synthase family protein [Denitromonas halophila]TVT69330.1 MAG: cystathionine gamma-synthase family protein [Denitromonas halophila]
MNDYENHTGTASVWAGEEHLFAENAICLPVYNSVTFGYDDMDEWHQVGMGKKKGHIYSRNTNPTVRPLEEKIRLMDGGEEATSFSTGMAAISNTLFTLLGPGDRVVAIKDTYGGSNKIFIKFLPQMKVDVCMVDTSDFDAIEREVKKGCKVLYLETPTNPTLKIVDIERLAKVAHEHGAIVVVDNTFATPINQRPISLGADVVVYSATKYLNGHSDVMGGLAVGKKALIDQIFHYREITGATLHPQSAYMILRGMKTLELRIARHNENAMKVATFLSQHPKVDQVFYPGLETHLNHAIAKKQMRGFGGMLSFSLKGGFENVVTVLENLKYAHKAASLGSVGTLVGPPRTTSHVELTEQERANAGIPESLIRYSAGIENGDDLVADLEQALAKI